MSSGIAVSSGLISLMIPVLYQTRQKLHRDPIPSLMGGIVILGYASASLVATCCANHPNAGRRRQALPLGERLRRGLPVHHSGEQWRGLRDLHLVADLLEYPQRRRE